MTALFYIFKTLADLYILTFLIRLLLQSVRADFFNPLSQFIVAVTNPLVMPLRRIVPRWRGVELAPVVVVLVLELAVSAALIALAGYAMPDPLILAWYAFLRTVVSVLRFFTFVIIAHVIIGWVMPHGQNPYAYLLAALCEPVLRPVRRVIPIIGGLDLSPLFVLIALQAVTMLVPLPRLLA